MQVEVATLNEKAVAITDADARKAEEAKATAKAAEIKARCERLQIYVNRLKDLDVDVASFQSFLIQATGEVRLDNVSVDAAVGLLDTWYQGGKDWLVARGPGLIFQVVVFLVLLLAFKILAGILGRITERALRVSKLKVSDLLRTFFINVVKKVTVLIGLIVALQSIGVPVAPLLAGVGVAGFVIGFALQDTLSNFAAGIMILLYRPYDIGHYVTAGGVSGTVKAMSLVSTTLFTPDNRVEVVPNKAIWGSVITNFNANATRRVDLSVGVSYSDDLDKTERVLSDVVTSHPLVLKDPAPVIKLNKLGESSVDFVVRPLSKSADYWTVYWDLTKAIKQRLDKEGISIPFPQRDIHVVSGVLAGQAQG